MRFSSTDLPEIKHINRSSISLKLNQTFYSWYLKHTHSPKEKEIVLKSSHIFLTPSFEDYEEAFEYTIENFFVILESILEKHIDDEEVLIQALTLEHFKSWVDLSFSKETIDVESHQKIKHQLSEIEGGLEIINL